MSNQGFYIPSGSVDEIEYNKKENKWHKMWASEFNEVKLVSICSKYWRNQATNGRYERYPDLAWEIF